MRYRAELDIATGLPGGPLTVALVRALGALVVLARQPDGRWLVVAETTDGADHPDLPVGED